MYYVRLTKFQNRTYATKTQVKSAVPMADAIYGPFPARAQCMIFCFQVNGGVDTRQTLQMGCNT